MQAQRIESVIKQELKRLGHDTVARIRFTDPIADAAALRHAAPYIGQRDAAIQRAVTPVEDQKCVSLSVAPFGIEALQPAPERSRLGRVPGPFWLPVFEKFPAFFADFGPLFFVTPLWRPQRKGRTG